MFSPLLGRRPRRCPPLPPLGSHGFLPLGVSRFFFGRRAGHPPFFFLFFRKNPLSFVADLAFGRAFFLWVASAFPPVCVKPLVFPHHQRLFSRAWNRPFSGRRAFLDLLFQTVTPTSIIVAPFLPFSTSFFFLLGSHLPTLVIFRPWYRPNLPFRVVLVPRLPSLWDRSRVDWFDAGLRAGFPANFFFFFTSLRSYAHALSPTL